MEPFPVRPVLIVDDDESALDSFETVLRIGGIDHVKRCADSREVLPMLARHSPACLILDLQMPYLSGQDLLGRLAEEFPEVPVVVVTGIDDVATAVACMKSGACDYLVKPVEKNQILATVRRLIELQDLKRSYAELRDRFVAGRLRRPEAFAAIITVDPAMKAIFQYLEAVAASPEPVFIVGETGVGKELAATALHSLSGRSGRFVAVNVAGVDDQVFADTLFGHERGAFTDAREIRRGLIREAEDGTLFLDEIGELSNASQVKLLRLLQDGEYYPLGADAPRRSRARVVVATNRDPDQLLVAGGLRKDLFHRLSAHRVRLPPLRERLDDLPLLVQHFVAEAAARMGKRKPAVPPQLIPLLRSHDFPGNIRELRALVYDALATHRGGALSLVQFKTAVGRGNAPSPYSLTNTGTPAAEDVTFTRLPTLKQAEETLIAKALEQSGDNQALAARLLGISRQALNERLRKRRKSACP